MTYLSLAEQQTSWPHALRGEDEGTAAFEVPCSSGSGVFSASAGEEHLLQEVPVLAELAVFIAESGVVALGAQLQQKNSPIEQAECSYQLCIATWRFNFICSFAEVF